MKIFECDAVVVGTGCAGYNCADWLYDFGYKNILIVTEGVKVGTSRNTGSDKQTYYKLSLAGNDGDSVKSMAETLFAGGAMDGDLALTEAANSAKSFFKLVSLGVRFPTNAYGEYVGYKTDHDPFQRATSVGPYTSKMMTEALENSVLKKGIRILDGCAALCVLKDEEGVQGLLALDLTASDKAEYIAIKSPHVVLATGGPAGIYYNSVYPACHTGSSSLALEAGAQFQNLSEWQFGLASVDFRWNVSGTYQQVLPRYISIDENGVEREFLKEHYESNSEMLKNIFLKGYEWPFDVRKIYGSSCIDLLVYTETVVKGRKVYLDFTREPSGLENGFEKLDKTAYEYLSNSDALLPLPINRLKKMNAGAINLYKEHGIDLTKEPLRIAVCAQHNNGGVSVNTDYETSVKGLYCIGEAAGVFGIFRQGGTALNSTQVGGLRAARHIARFSQRKENNNFEALLVKAVADCNQLIEATKGRESTLLSTREKYQKEMSRDFAFLRSISDMEEGVHLIEKYLTDFEKENRWKNYSEIAQLFKNYDIAKMARIVSQVFLETAKRYGSRGGSYVLSSGDVMARNPVPENEEGRKNVLIAQQEADGIKIHLRPVRPIPARELWFEKVWNDFKE